MLQCGRDCGVAYSSRSFTGFLFVKGSPEFGVWMLIPLDLSLVSAVVSTTCRLKPQVYCCHLCVAACSWLGYVLRLGLSLECAGHLNTTWWGSLRAGHLVCWHSWNHVNWPALRQNLHVLLLQCRTMASLPPPAKKARPIQWCIFFPLCITQKQYIYFQLLIQVERVSSFTMLIYELLQNARPAHDCKIHWSLLQEFQYGNFLYSLHPLQSCYLK